MKRFFSFLAFILLFHGGVFSTHIVGGELTCKHLTANTFRLQLIIYRDCLTGLAPFDSEIKVGIFDRVTHALIDSSIILLDTFVVVEPTGVDCVIPPDVCVEAGYYIEDINLANNPNGYYLVWERCCRNHSVSNILDPGAAGMTFYLEVPDPAIENSSPEFSAPPLPFLCENNPFTYNFTAFDPDGDSLVYTLVDPSSGNSGNGQGGALGPVLLTPLPAPYPPIVWTNGYSLANIAGGDPIIIDPVTGIISGAPDYLGLYAMAVKIDEYRNGIRIGQVRREIEFVVLLCDDNKAPQFSANVKDTTYTVYPGDSLCFNFTVTDQNQDSLFVSYSGNIFASGSISPPFAVTAPDSGSSQVNMGFCWYPECHQISNIPYEVEYRAVDDGCPLPKTSIAHLKILVAPPPPVNPVNLLCIQFISNDKIRVRFGDSNPMYRYFSSRQVYRSENGGPFIVIDTIHNPNLREFLDQNAFNNQTTDYCYFIININSCGFEGLPSDTICTLSALNPLENYIATVSVVEENQIKIKWAYHPDYLFSTLYLLRSDNTPGSIPVTIKKFINTVDIEFIDKNVKTSEQSYCYTLYSEDICGNLTPVSKEACTILLSGTAEPFTNYITWNEYINWLGGVDAYEIWRKRVGDTNFRLVNTATEAKDRFGDSQLDLDAGTFTYFIRAREASGLKEQSKSNEIILEQEPILYVPNAFTPNNDGYNDSWGIVSAFVKDIDIHVFNRFGNEVFTSNALSNKWDGTWKSSELPQGVYVYILDYKGFNSKLSIQKKGRVSIIR